MVSNWECFWIWQTTRFNAQDMVPKLIRFWATYPTSPVTAQTIEVVTLALNYWAQVQTRLFYSLSSAWNRMSDLYPIPGRLICNIYIMWCIFSELSKERQSVLRLAHWQSRRRASFRLVTSCSPHERIGYLGPAQPWCDGGSIKVMFFAKPSGWFCSK